MKKRKIVAKEEVDEEGDEKNDRRKTKGMIGGERRGKKKEDLN